MIEACKNPFCPQPAAHGGQGVGECHTGFLAPGDCTFPLPLRRQVRVDHRDHRGQSKQARRRPQHRFLAPATPLFQLQPGPHLWERRLDVPTPRVRLHYLLDAERDIRAEKVFLAVRATQVRHIYPPQGDQT